MLAHTDLRRRLAIPAAGRCLRRRTRLHFEEIAAVARHRHRQDPAHAEGERLARGRGERQPARLSRPHARDIALVHFDDHAEALVGRERHQHFAALHRGAERLRQVALDNHAVERRADAGALELVLDQRELRLGFGGLRVVNHELRAIGARQRGAIEVLVLRELALALGALGLQIAHGELRDHVVRAHPVPGAHVDLIEEAVDRRRHDALHRAFQAGGRADVVRHGNERGCNRRSDHRERHPLARRVGRGGQPGELLAQGVKRDAGRRTSALSLELEERAHEAGEVLAKRRVRRFERAAAPLEGDCAEGAAGIDHRNGAYASAEKREDLGVRRRDERSGGFASRQHDRGGLLDRLVHRCADLFELRLARVEVDAVRAGDDAGAAVSSQPTDTRSQRSAAASSVASAAAALRQAVLREHGRLQLQHDSRCNAATG